MKTLIMLCWQRTLRLEEPKESFHSTPLFRRNGTKAKKGQMTCPRSTGHIAAKPGCTQVSQLSSISVGLSQGPCCSHRTPESSTDNFGCHWGRVLVAAGSWRPGMLLSIPPGTGHCLQWRVIWPCTKSHGTRQNGEISSYSCHYPEHAMKTSIWFNVVLYKTHGTLSWVWDVCAIHVCIWHIYILAPFST